VSGALDGLIVTELGQSLAAGLCGSLLAQLGATVVAIEPAAGETAYRPQLIAGKLSFAPQRDSAADAAVLHKLLGRSDCILTSSDIDAPAVLPTPADRGGPVICDITAFGATGPMAGQPWTDWQIQALSGIADTTGMADGPPIAIALPMPAILTSAYAAGAVIAGVRARRLSGIGQSIDMAVFDCAFASTNTFLSGFFAGKGVTKSRMGNRHPTVAPWNLFAARDGWVMICIGSDAQWKRLCDLIGRPDLAAPFMKQADRIAHTAEIDDAIAAWTSRLDVEACTTELAKASIAS
jgi:crotonobetainyl-CoA:carnitine CoA-transferase CaiB-like acyl-CoA transferase